MKNTHITQRAFSLLELLVVITIIAVLASISMPAYTKVIEKARLSKDVSNQKQIVTALRLYAFDNDGVFPLEDSNTSGSGGGGGQFSNSTDALQELIIETDLGTDEIFYTQGNPSKLSPPNGDSELEPEENCMVYIIGMTDTSPSGAPIIADEMESAGTYGENHPWLRSRRAVVGYVGGHVKIEKLNQRTAGATVIGPKGSGIDDIFQPQTVDEETGESTGGRMPSNISTDAILLPGS